MARCVEFGPQGEAYETSRGVDPPVENTRGCHFFNYPSDKWAGRSPARSVYSDCIVEMDSVFGRLMKTLEDTHQDENTLVILTSDNGPECEVPPHAQTLFRGCKGTSWEGGVRIPMLVYWKGMIPARRSDALTDQVDIFNSALSVAGVGDEELLGYLPKGKYITGVDQSSFWLTDNGLPERRSRIYTMNRYFSAGEGGNLSPKISTNYRPGDPFALPAGGPFAR